MIRDSGIYGQDGSGYYWLSTEGYEEGYFENPERGIHQILHELLKQSNFEDIMILN